LKEILISNLLSCTGLITDSWLSVPWYRGESGSNTIIKENCNDIRVKREFTPYAGKA
jgi:hypothetical protein